MRPDPEFDFRELRPEEFMLATEYEYARSNKRLRTEIKKWHSKTFGEVVRAIHLNKLSKKRRIADVLTDGVEKLTDDDYAAVERSAPGPLSFLWIALYCPEFPRPWLRLRESKRLIRAKAFNKEQQDLAPVARCGRSPFTVEPPFRYLLDNFDTLQDPARGTEYIVARIDWREPSKKKFEAAFRRWLNLNWERMKGVRETRGRRPKDPHLQLKRLAEYRVAEKYRGWYKAVRGFLDGYKVDHPDRPDHLKGVFPEYSSQSHWTEDVHEASHDIDQLWPLPLHAPRSEPLTILC